MTRIVFVEHDGGRFDCDVADGATLQQAAAANGVAGIRAECGGELSCATCHCYIDDAAFRALLPPPNEDEDLMLECLVLPREEGSRLACQIKVKPHLAGMVVRVASEQV